MQTSVVERQPRMLISKEYNVGIILIVVCNQVVPSWLLNCLHSRNQYMRRIDDMSREGRKQVPRAPVKLSAEQKRKWRSAWSGAAA